MISANLVELGARRSLSRLMRFDDQRTAWPPAGTDPTRVNQLYLHIPFCTHLCPFCSFHRVRYRPAKAGAYFEALHRELARYRDLGFRFTDIYIGGGTPTVEPGALASVLEQVHHAFPVQTLSIETNASNLTDATLGILERARVQRLSVGVQSFDDDLLKLMGRYSPYGSSAEMRAHLTRAQGRFQTLNVDMMFNLPGQTREVLKADLALLRDELQPDQVSYYPLMIAPSVKRSVSQRMGAFSLAQEREFYELIRSELSGDYQAASVWCFSRGRGAIDEYIVDHDDYVGIGSGAFSYLNGVMASTTFSLRGYEACLRAGDLPVVRTRTLTPREQMRYALLVKLFGMRVTSESLERRFDGRFRRTMWREILAARMLGAVRDTGVTLELTERGMYLWLVLMREFLNSVNELRTSMRHHIRAELREWNARPVGVTSPAV